MGLCRVPEKDGWYPSSLTVHALERQESNALLHLYILFQGEGEPLQPGNDLFHLPSPAGAAKSCSAGRWTLYSSRRPLRRQGLMPGAR